MLAFVDLFAQDSAVAGSLFVRRAAQILVTAASIVEIKDRLVNLIHLVCLVSSFSLFALVQFQEFNQPSQFQKVPGNPGVQ